MNSKNAYELSMLLLKHPEIRVGIEASNEMYDGYLKIRVIDYSQPKPNSLYWTVLVNDLNNINGDARLYAIISNAVNKLLAKKS